MTSRKQCFFFQTQLGKCTNSQTLSANKADKNLSQRREVGTESSTHTQLKLLLVLDCSWKRKACFLQWNKNWYIKHIPGQVPCPRIIGQHKLDSQEGEGQKKRRERVGEDYEAGRGERIWVTSGEGSKYQTTLYDIVKGNNVGIQHTHIVIWLGKVRSHLYSTLHHIGCINSSRCQILA